MNRKSLYLFGLAAFVLLVAAARWDLVEQAAGMTVRQFNKGGAARTRLLFEVALFAAILALTVRAIPTRIDPRRDGLLLVLGLAAGWCAEAWGTRLYLWRYYTGETPPLWIVPAWPLGVLVIDRLAPRTAAVLERRLSERGFAAAYAALVVLSAAVFLYFSQPVLRHPATWALGAALLAGLLVKPEPRTAVPILLTGFGCVFFADLWGTTNGCWRYYIQHASVPMGLWIGVAFGMTFDTAVVFLCLRVGPGGQRT